MTQPAKGVAVLPSLLYGTACSGDVSVTGLEERDGRWVNPQATTSSITVDFEVQRAIGDLKIIAE
jgi:hypothetical protein